MRQVALMLNEKKRFNGIQNVQEAMLTHCSVIGSLAARRMYTSLCYFWCVTCGIVQDFERWELTTGLSSTANSRMGTLVKTTL